MTDNEYFYRLFKIAMYFIDIDFITIDNVKKKLYKFRKMS